MDIGGGGRKPTLRFPAIGYNSFPRQRLRSTYRTHNSCTSIIHFHCFPQLANTNKPASTLCRSNPNLQAPIPSSVAGSQHGASSSILASYGTIIHQPQLSPRGAPPFSPRERIASSASASRWYSSSIVPQNSVGCCNSIVSAPRPPMHALQKTRRGYQYIPLNPWESIAELML